MSRAQLTSTVEQNTGGAVAPFVAGKNKVINGDFGIWQRGTSFNPSGTGYFYTSDRWQSYSYAASSQTISQQSFTIGTAPISGYEGTYFLRSTSTNTAAYINQPIEDVRTYAGQTITVSFWAKAASNQTIVVVLDQYFGSGGSATVNVGAQNNSATTAWQRFIYTVAVPSISGKTIGTGSYLSLTIRMDVTNVAMDVWGVQVERGSVATPFTTASNTFQGELALCQRYFVRWGGSTVYESMANAVAASTTGVSAYPIMPVQMRVQPTSVAANALAFYDTVTVFPLTTPTINANINGTKMVQINFTGSSLTQFRYGALIANNSYSSYLDLSAEL